MAEIKLDVSKRFLTLISIFLVFFGFVTIASGGSEPSFPLSWITFQGNSVDSNNNGQVDMADNSEKLGGLSSQDIILQASTGGSSFVSSSESSNSKDFVVIGDYALTEGGNPNFCMKIGTDGRAIRVNNGYSCNTNSQCWDGKCLEINNGGNDYCRKISDLSRTDIWDVFNNDEICNTNGEVCNNGYCPSGQNLVKVPGQIPYGGKEINYNLAQDNGLKIYSDFSYSGTVGEVGTQYDGRYIIAQRFCGNQGPNLCEIMGLDFVSFEPGNINGNSNNPYSCLNIDLASSSISKSSLQFSNGQFINSVTCR